MENKKERDMTPAEARRAYHKEWRARNKDKIHEYNKRHWERVADRANSELEQQQEPSSDSEKEKQDGR